MSHRCTASVVLPFPVPSRPLPETGWFAVVFVDADRDEFPAGVFGGQGEALAELVDQGLEKAQHLLEERRWRPRGDLVLERVESLGRRELVYVERPVVLSSIEKPLSASASATDREAAVSHSADAKSQRARNAQPYGRCAMANWTANCLLISGDDEHLDALLTAVRGIDATGAPLLFDLARARAVPDNQGEQPKQNGWERIEGCCKDGAIGAEDVWVIRYRGRVAVAVRCEGEPPTSDIAALARRFPELQFRLLWTQPDHRRCGAVDYDSDGRQHEHHIPLHADPREPIRVRGWDERTWPLDSVLPAAERTSMIEFGRYDYTLDDIANELADHPSMDELGDTATPDDVLSFTPAEIARMVDLASNEIDEIDDDAGIDETTLLCRAAITILTDRDH